MNEKYTLTIGQLQSIFEDIQETADKNFNNDDIRIAINRVVNNYKLLKSE